MVRRILRSAMVLAAIIAAYQAYVTLAVPQMEPQLAMSQRRRLTQEELERVPESSTSYQRLLANYFPKDHWSQLRPPKVIANAGEQVMLVFDDFKRSPLEGNSGDESKNTRVDIERITFLMFPTPPREGMPAPTDAIILEAPQGARFVFDEFRPELGKIGKILRGDFPGPIRIHSQMRDPGPEDDLLIEVNDLAMNTKMLYTTQPNSPVNIRMGQNIGSGTDLEVRFLADDHSKPDDPGLKIAGIESLEIRRDVKMRMELDTGSLLAAKKEPPAIAGEANPSVQVTDPSAVPPAPPKPPVELTCTGPFLFDAVSYKASFDRDVEVRQINPDGPSDQILCSRFDIRFTPKPPVDGAPQPIVVDPGKRQQRDLSRLEPAMIEAGGHPAVISSPKREAQARGDTIQIWLKQQRVRISGGSDSMLAFGLNVLRAPIIDYEQPPRGDGTSVGRFGATGPGSLDYVADRAKPQDVLHADWQTSVILGREKGQPVLVLDGRPKIAFATAGAITADQVWLYLRELDGPGLEGIPIGGSNGQAKLRLAPDRLTATGHVEVVSPQLTARTQKLSAAFRIEPQAVASAAATPAGAAQGAAVAPTSNAAAKPQQAAPANPLAGMLGGTAPANGQPQQSYFVDADQIRIDMIVRGQSAVPSGLACVGHIVLREMSQVATGQQPLEIRGGQLKVDHLDTNSPHVTLLGEDPTEAESNSKTGSMPTAPHRAQLAGRGITVLSDVVELDGKDNRLWSNGPGKATLLVAGGLTGKSAVAGAQPTPVDLDWQGGLRFDGRTITFERDVRVSSMDGNLRCDKLSATLLTPIKFGQKFDQSNADLSEIECLGQVMIENVTRDAGGLTSHDRVQLRRLAINQKTGGITGDGPGIIRSTRYGNALSVIPGAPAAVNGQPPTAPQANPAGSKLSFIGVEFQGGLDGNMYTRELTFHNRVRTVYGPVDAWEQELDPGRPETMSPDAITLTCDDLRLNEDAVAARTMPALPDGSKRQIGPIQMTAKGDVRIEGQVPKQGEFSVQADTATYEEIKQVFVLEGNTRSPAKLWRRDPAGGGAGPPTEAHRIRYNRLTGDIKVEGIQFFEIRPQDLQNAQRPKDAPK